MRTVEKHSNTNALQMNAWKITSFVDCHLKAMKNDS